MKNKREQKKVAIIGCGLIGQSWAVNFLSSGFSVSLFDPIEGVVEAAKKEIKEKLDVLKTNGLINDGNLPNYSDKIFLARSLPEVVQDVIYVQESGPEDLYIKKKLTQNIDKVTQEHIPIASSTSGIPASSYAADVPGQSRCIVAHPINPPHLIPAVEIIPAPFTSKIITETVKKIICSMGKQPIELKKEIPGFIVNRLQGALLIEAFNLVKDGIASAQEIDRAISEGLGLRWAIMGPFKTIHLNAPEGIKGYVERYENMYQDMFKSSDLNWAELIKDGLETDLLKLYPLEEREEQEEQRNSKLMQLISHKT
jgi:L-gulonate 3-dehydrogenase